MAIYKNVAGQKLAVMAYNTTDGSLVTGDAANITGSICLDGSTSSATNDVNPVEPSGQTGMYVFDLTQAETNSELILLTASSTTSNVQLEPVQVLTVNPADFMATGFNTVAPDNASITAILADTNELQGNQGDWATATGFSTFDPATDVVANVTLVDTTTDLTNGGGGGGGDATSANQAALQTTVNNIESKLIRRK